MLDQKIKSSSRPRKWGSLLFWVFLFVLAMVVAQMLSSKKALTLKLNYSEFLSLVEIGKIESCKFKGKEIEGEFSSPYEVSYAGKKLEYTRFSLYIPFDDPELPKKLAEQGVDVIAQPESSTFWNIVISILPWLLIPALYLLFLYQVKGGQGNILSFGKNRATRVLPDKIRVTFEDVAGCDEAKQELQEIIEFLKNPQKFSYLGGRVPRGVLLLGAPGTGKTLLARAVAGEANVPFFSISGSDFVEMFVGVGASRVRDLFNEAKRNKPCIVFIDEIDAVGRWRGAGIGGGHDEREQTLNQLLVEMDGFDPNEGIIVMAATNRPDVLDLALLRPGRFDRQVVVDRPDVKGRYEIFKVHSKNKPLAEDVDLMSLAQGTPGLVGADLENIVNEAALIAARKGKTKIEMEDFESAKDKVLMGLERKSITISPQEKKISAYHESGHALVGKLIPGADPVHKVSIIPRGMSLGVTYFLPQDDKRLYSKLYLNTKLVHLLGGRAAEIIVFGEPTTGAGNDLHQATEIARKMVTEWGMSDRIGPVNLAEGSQEIFLGKEIVSRSHISNKMSEIIDDEIKRIVEEAQDKAVEVLRNSIDKLHKLATALLEKEILTGEEIDRILGLEKAQSLS